MSVQANRESSFYYFEHPTMQGLCACLENWRTAEDEKHIRFISIQKDREAFCCIVLAECQSILIEEEVKKRQEEMARFQRKALKRIGKAVEFSSEYLESGMIQDIQAKLKICETAAEVRSVFLEMSQK
ncbi:MAG: hypothetical protein KBE23_22420 [Chloroflexi bacterium]|nr:hypothetical protein [Chloroflexota bacterium]MBP7045523.1 hypothetical protein [Chloroflexota bacterium]